MVCHVSGNVQAVTGQPMGGLELEFQSRRLWSGGDQVIVPQAAVAISDSSGAVAVDLHPGDYMLAVTVTTAMMPRTARSTIHARVVVPDAPTADLADLIDGVPPMTPPLVDQARRFRDEAREARDEALEAIPDGSPGQVLGWDAQGEMVPMPMPPADLPDGSPGQIVGYDDNGLAVAVDPPLPQLSSQQW